MTTLEPVWKFPKDAIAAFLLATMGQDHPVYRCPFCRKDTEHAQKVRDGVTIVVCLECAQGSRVVDDDE